MYVFPFMIFCASLLMDVVILVFLTLYLVNKFVMIQKPKHFPLDFSIYHTYNIQCRSQSRTKYSCKLVYIRSFMNTFLLVAKLLYSLKCLSWSGGNLIFLAPLKDRMLKFQGLNMLIFFIFSPSLIKIHQFIGVLDWFLNF